MKLTLIFLFVAFAIKPCKAQWQEDTGLGGHDPYVQAFGIHDSTLFAMWIDPPPPPPDHPSVVALRARDPLSRAWFTDETGIDFSQGTITSFASLGQYIFAGMTTHQGGGGPAYRSSNSGANWTLNSNGPICSNGSILFCDGIYRSTDSGNTNTWEQVTNLECIALAAMGTHIFASANGGVSRSTDNGMNWSQETFPLASPVTYVEIDTIIFAGSSTGKTGLARSNDSGATWTQVNFAHPVTALATDGKNLWVGTTDSGVYISTDTGQSWRAVSDGLGHWLTVSAMIVFDTVVYVSTGNSGDFERPYFNGYRRISEMTDTTASSVVQTMPSSDTLSIYPNPAGSMVTIISGGTSIFGVSVLNVLGEDVLDMPNLRESELTLDVSKLPSGTYFVHIETSNGSVLRKVVIQH